MTIEHPAAALSTLGRTQSPERAMVSARCVIFDRDGQRVLVVRLAPDRRPPGQQYLYLPGGRVHEGESPSAAADREVGEELGLRHLRAGRLLLTAWTTPRYRKLRPRLQLLFDFGRHDCRALADRIVLQTEEISGFLWIDIRGNRRLYPAQARQLNAIMKKRTYLEQDPVPRDQNTR
jgi:8-oxo-dGTP diphosphatase